MSPNAKNRFRLRSVTSVAAATLALAVVAGAQPVVGPQVRIDNGGTIYAANETTIASTDLYPLEIVGAWNDYRTPGT